jgi:uncharacterized protein (DUF305 family)
MLRPLAAVLLVLSFNVPALAQEDHAGHQAPASAVGSAAADAFAEANARMHTGMDIDYSGDPDTAFVNGMIAHHQGAVDMANVILQFGEDDEIAELARKVIAAQTAEIAWMRDWLARKGKE